MQKKKIFFKSSFSKAEFELIKYKKDIFLKKKIDNPNLRDFKSILKNNDSIKELKIKNLKISKIHIKNYKELVKTKSFKSIYIDGYSADLIFLNSGVKEVLLIKNFLYDYFSFLKKKIIWIKIDQNIFLKKLDRIEKKIKIAELKIFFKKKKDVMKKKIKKISIYPTGMCHGDLTLSNMILKKDKIYLIDFLQTYNDSILQDLSKVYQEFVLGWSSRQLSEQEKLRAQIICKKLINKKFFNLFPKEILKHLYFETLMTLFRIFPYVKKDDKITIKWLKNSVNSILKVEGLNKSIKQSKKI